ncbi:sensor histidine kinase [Polaribacter huanghezhanensis]|uniref:sensor histidine kinase n=1 Tax=Polaribacter huanghezhanensis TaxID=1354726 RepID=UPI002647B1E9|nr:HAMP domain-containing sensor histidine kinase [Polaribacter huanghezhanensis]
MGKKMFVLIVALMSFSLIGIVTVQVYWISNAVDTKKKQFLNDVKIALTSVSEEVSDKEYAEFQRKIKPYLDKTQNVKSNELRNFILQQIDTTGKQITAYSLTVLEQNIKVPIDFLENDSLVVKRITGREDIFNTNKFSANTDFSKNKASQIFTTIKRYPEYEEIVLKDAFKVYKSSFPIHKRISNRELNTTLKKEFTKRGIHIDFKYGVYSSDGYLTNLKSGYYTINKANSISSPLFVDDSGNSEFKLYVTFPNQQEHILADISNILLLSVFFIFIIIVAFSSSLYQIIKQKKISEIKSDFINNMTHEFKTPIATINLALDAIKNPKIINDSEKVNRYVKMIREENKRMHAQVENVLRISRLEKNQIDIHKIAIDMDDIVEDAISHVRLLVTDKKGNITTHLHALQSEVLGNDLHLTNVVVNILENALKYSNDEPNIEVFTESTAKFFILKIKDDGIGMSKSAQKYVFDKFYREHKGDIHNVKGHGLGLAYVKEIVESHQGTVFVESEKGKGSTFTVKLPLI